MLLQLGMLKQLPVAALDEEARVGTVLDVVLHPDTGELIGFWIQPMGWLSRKKALSSRDVVSYEAQAIIINSHDSLLSPDEIQPFKSATRRRERWLGKRVESEEHEYIGRVSDLVIETDLEMLAKIHVNQLFGPERIIAREQIVKVTPKIIVVRDSTRRATVAESFLLKEQATA
ncbi:PRC-barrel domain-containing protein [Candidatus Berkelbacteria bacterium]|nr:PRC-barrel domain-containing protein [Candidatus Berkelbacteria bacterium]